MATQNWREKLRNVASDMLTAIAHLHPLRPSTVRLVSAATDVFQLQESVNISLEDAISREREWRRLAETRISRLAEKLEAAENVSLALQLEVNALKRREAQVPQTEFESQQKDLQVDALFKWKRKEREAEDNFLSASPLKRKRTSTDEEVIEPATFSSPCEDSEADEENVIKAAEHPLPAKGLSASLKSKGQGQDAQNAPLDLQSKRVRPQISLPVTPPRKPLPPLPTLEDVERDWRFQKAEKRAKDNYKPLPCAKCKLRKRAVMLRQDGYIKEAVFERWTKQPGNCLDYMHQDESVPEGKYDYSLTFKETETQPP